MVSLLGQSYNNEDSDSEGAESSAKSRRFVYCALSEDESDDENGPVSKPGRLSLDDYSSTELLARLHVKPRGSFNRELVAHRAFHNPHFLNGILKKFKIEQYGTDYPKEMYCPKDSTTIDLCYTFLSEKVLEFERKRLVKAKDQRPDGTVKPEEGVSLAPSDRKRPSKWSEAVKPPPDAPMPLLPGLGLPLPAQAAIPPSAVYNPLQQAITIAARLKTLTHKPASIPPTAPAPAYVPTSAATAAAVAAAAAAARERAAKASINASEDEINRKRQAALTLLRESAEKKRKQQGGG
jgi:hypothetical protein